VCEQREGNAGGLAGAGRGTENGHAVFRHRTEKIRQDGVNRQCGFLCAQVDATKSGCCIHSTQLLNPMQAASAQRYTTPFEFRNGAYFLSSDMMWLVNQVFMKSISSTASILDPPSTFPLRSTTCCARLL
jgi:hypothetical protein